MSKVLSNAISAEFANRTEFGFQLNPKSGNCTGKTGNPNTQLFLNIIKSKIKIPGMMKVIFDFKTINAYKKTAIGSQIIVGFSANTKTENTNNKEAFLLWFKYSLSTIKAIAITGKSGLGDCENRKRTGRKRRWIQDFFSKI